MSWQIVCCAKPSVLKKQIVPILGEPVPIRHLNEGEVPGELPGKITKHRMIGRILEVWMKGPASLNLGAAWDPRINKLFLETKVDYFNQETGPKIKEKKFFIDLTALFKDRQKIEVAKVYPSLNAGNGKGSMVEISATSAKNLFNVKRSK